MIYVYPRAIHEYQERVHACSDDVARAEILCASRGIEAAATIGCQVVRLASRARLILDGENVITVYGADQLPRQLRRIQPLTESPDFH
jgi:hypothetical protein